MRWTLFFCALLFCVAAQAAQPKLQVVTSFSILEDIAKQIGGDKVEVKSLVGRNQDMHSYEPKPADVKLLKHADLFIVNGLGLEGFIDRLVEASGFRGDIVVATHGVIPIRNRDTEEKAEHGEFDPHAWQSLKNGQIYARNIATAFAAKDPKNKEYYSERLKGFILRTQELSIWAIQEIATIPKKKRSIIVTHNAFNYLTQEYGVMTAAIEESSIAGESSAKRFALIIDWIGNKRAFAVFSENTSNSPTGHWICENVKLKCGILYSDALTEKKGKAYTYFELFESNITAITSALK